MSFEAFAQEWESVYPAMIKSWRDVWDDFESFLEFTPELRKIVYSTNAIESLNARFRKAAVRRGHFPTDQAALKVLYLTSIERQKNRKNPTSASHRALIWVPVTVGAGMSDVGPRHLRLRVATERCWFVTLRVGGGLQRFRSLRAATFRGEVLRV